MRSSRDIDELRPDVAANCRIFLRLCGEAGLDVLVTGTVRDAEFQRRCYERGTAKSPLPAFHAIGVGLAFDICKNVKGHEYDDAAFFRACGEIGEKIGFEWGGRWRTIVDMPHFQWSGAGHGYSSADIIAGRLPPPMPIYTEKEDKGMEKITVKIGSVAVPGYLIEDRTFVPVRETVEALNRKTVVWDDEKKMVTVAL